MNLISIDLGSTNVKVMAYDTNFRKLWSSTPHLAGDQDSLAAKAPSGDL